MFSICVSYEIQLLCVKGMFSLHRIRYMLTPIRVQHHSVVLTSFILWLKYAVFSLLMYDAFSWRNLVFFGIPTVLVMTLVVSWWNKKPIARYLCTINVVWSLLLVTVLLYYDQFGIIVTYHALFQANQVIDIKESILALVRPTDLLFFIDFMLIGIARMSGIVATTTNRLPSKSRWRVIWVSCIVLLVTNTLTHRDILNEINKFENMGLLAYQIQAMTNDIVPAMGTPLADITATRIQQLHQNPLPHTKKYTGVAQRRHLILVQLESYQNFLVDLSLDGKAVSPTLQQLRQHALYFPRIYQSIGQGNTSDAEFIVNTAFYPPAQQAASHKYSAKALPSLPRRLHTQHYTTLTLHTNDVHFWNRDQLYAALGFAQYYDKTYFGNEDVIAFGASDEVLYAKTIDVLTPLHQSKSPFYAHVIAQSSHHPFIAPAGKPTFPLPEAWKNTLVGNYVTMANYADRALGTFIAQLKKQGIWEQCLFVVYGDHFGLSAQSLSATDLTLLEQARGKPYDALTMYNIPLFISVPGVTNTPVTVPQPGGQIDIMPTVLNLLGYDWSNEIVFGQDLLNQKHHLGTSRFYLPTGSFFDDDVLYVSGETFSKGKVFALDPKKIISSDVEAYRASFERMNRLLEYNDAYVQSLPER